MPGAADTGSLQAICWLGEPAAAEAGEVGGKAANLSRLADRWPVPPGFCLPARLHRQASGAGAGGQRTLRRLVSDAYRELGRRVGARRPAVAVRSSAIGEDGASVSFAGQHDTVLNAAGARAVVAAVQRCWASADAAHARAYRGAHGLEERPAMGVLVQRLVDADVAAVVFSVDPVTGERSEVVINASWGLGQAVVDGTVTPDTYRVSRAGLQVARAAIADKDVMVTRRRRGVRQIPVPDERRRVAALTEDQCRELARLAVDLEHELGCPVDLECAYAGGRLAVLQCRPITALPGS